MELRLQLVDLRFSRMLHNLPMSGSIVKITIVLIVHRPSESEILWFIRQP